MGNCPRSLAVFLIQSQTKVCSKCKTEKPSSNFRPRKERNGQLFHACKSCEREVSREWMRKNPEKAAAQRRRWYVRNSKKEAERAARYKSRNPEKVSAQNSVHNAVYNGLLPRIRTQNCCNCGTQATHYHHHKGYAPEHRLDVVPVCGKCHKAMEREGVQ